MTWMLFQKNLLPSCALKSAIHGQTWGWGHLRSTILGQRLANFWALKSAIFGQEMAWASEGLYILCGPERYLRGEFGTYILKKCALTPIIVFAIVVNHWMALAPSHHSRMALQPHISLELVNEMLTNSWVSELSDLLNFYLISFVNYS